MEETHVVTVFVRNGTDVLLLRRSEAVGSYRGQWGAVAGHAEGDPDALAREELVEETGISLDEVTLVRTGEPFDVVDEDRNTTWVVHPFLFDCETRDVETDWETTEYEWCPPTEILDRETVPDLWTSYERVAPTVETIENNETHGSATLSLRALEVLRDRAAAGADWSALTSLARNLRAARPSMAAVENRVNRMMANAADGETATTEAVLDTAHEEIDAALDADDRAAAVAAERLSGRHVVTLSRSGTVRDALLDGEPATVTVAESRPGGEGVAIAGQLADEGVDVTLVADSELPTAVADADCVLVGADGVLPDGSVMNKVGTRGAALAADFEGVPCWVVCSRDKVQTDGEVDREERDASELYAGDAALTVRNPTFDVTPATLVDAVLTESGALDTDDVEAVAAEHRANEEWG